MTAFLRGQSLRKALALYVAVFLLLALALCALTDSACDAAEDRILASYAGEGQRYWLTNEQGERLGEGVRILSTPVLYAPEDEAALHALDTVRMAAPAVWASLCILAAAFLFYRNRLKGPLEELRRAARKISANDLNFTVQVSREDELGQLCRTFEYMRATLEGNFSSLWRQVEERRQLNRAFSHDLRTPLTVLRGYSEILQESEDPHTRETAATMGRQISRMEEYVASMSQLQRLEDAQPARRKVESAPFLSARIQEAEILCQGAGTLLRAENRVPPCALELDGEFVSQVCDNLLSNAVRFASQEISLVFALREDRLVLAVGDDGPGFTPEGLRRAMEPCFSQETRRSEHFGIGLTICRLLCQAHGGSLRLENRGPGALVTAEFEVSSPE